MHADDTITGLTFLGVILFAAFMSWDIGRR